MFNALDFYFVTKLDVAFDGADEVDESLNLIKGGGYDNQWLFFWKTNNLFTNALTEFCPS